MVKTLVFAGLKFTFHNFDQLDKCANQELKADGNIVDNCAHCSFLPSLITL